MLLEKLTAAHPVTLFSAFYATRIFCAAWQWRCSQRYLDGPPCYLSRTVTSIHQTTLRRFESPKTRNALLRRSAASQPTPDESSPHAPTVLWLFKIQLNVILSSMPNVGSICVRPKLYTCYMLCCVRHPNDFRRKVTITQVLTHSAAVISHAQMFQPQYLYAVWNRNVLRTMLTLKMEALQLFETPGPQPTHSISDRTWTDESWFDFQ